MNYGWGRSIGAGVYPSWVATTVYKPGLGSEHGSPTVEADDKEGYRPIVTLNKDVRINLDIKGTNGQSIETAWNLK